MQNYLIYKKLEEIKVIPIIAIERVELSEPLADALTEGGLPVAEITFRTKEAAKVITKLNKERPNLIVGAGTILTIDDLNRAKDCGAEFGVAPGLNRKIVEESLKIGLPFSPGIMTPSDIALAVDYGIQVVKFFPAEAAGGVQMLQSLYAPYKHTGVRFIPTGGINADNFRQYLSLSSVIAVGGTWIANPDDIATENWQKVRENCRVIKELI